MKKLPHITKQIKPKQITLSKAVSTMIYIYFLLKYVILGKDVGPQDKADREAIHGFSLHIYYRNPLPMWVVFWVQIHWYKKKSFHTS